MIRMINIINIIMCCICSVVGCVFVVLIVVYIFVSSLQSTEGRMCTKFAIITIGSAEGLQVLRNECITFHLLSIFYIFIRLSAILVAHFNAHTNTNRVYDVGIHAEDQTFFSNFFFSFEF